MKPWPGAVQGLVLGDKLLSRRPASRKGEDGGRERMEEWEQNRTGKGKGELQELCKECTVG